MGKTWVDYAYYLGNEDDGVYYIAELEEADGRWYATAMVDCDTGGFCGDLLLDNDGPYGTEVEALEAGYYAACDWCYFNEVEFDDAPDHTMP